MLAGLTLSTDHPSIPLTARTIILVGYEYEALYRNYREPSKSMVLVHYGAMTPVL